MVVSGCDLFNPSEPLPVYLSLQVPVVVDPATGQTETLGIKDFWIDHNGERLGVFRLPTIVPLIPAEDRNQLTIQGGIFQNGLSSFRAPYVFWQPQTFDLQPTPLDTIAVDLTLTYWSIDSVLDVRFYEDFEGASFRLNNTSQTNGTVMRTRSPGYRSNRSGYVAFSENAYRFEASANQAFRLPQGNNNDIYMEVTFRSNVPFTMGLAYAGVLTQTSGLLPLGVTYNSNLEWRTIYVHLGALVRSIPDDAIFTPYFQATSLDQENNQGLPGELWLDNIRIIQFAE